MNEFKKGDYVKFNKYSEWSSYVCRNCPDRLKYPFEAKLIEVNHNTDNTYLSASININGRLYGVYLNKDVQLLSPKIFYEIY